MSEQTFWHWTALGVTPLTVGNKNRRNNNKKLVATTTTCPNGTTTTKQHRRNSLVILNDDSNTSSTSHCETITKSIHIRVSSTTIDNRMEIELEEDQYYSRFDTSNVFSNRGDRFDNDDFETDTLRTPPEYHFVFEDKDEDDIDNDHERLASFRLSIAGMNQQQSSNGSSRTSKSSDDYRDELHSSLYSNVLETVRCKLVDCIPQITEEMVSRAIINAFSDSNIDRQLYASDSFDSDDVGGGDTYYDDKYQDQVNILCKTFEFMQEHQNRLLKRKKKLEDFVQTILNDVFLKIRREEITSSDEVLRTMLSVMSILRIKVRNNAETSFLLPTDTILLHGLPNHTSRRDLIQHLSVFGEISSVAMTTTTIGNRSTGRGFGYCCYAHEDSVQRSLNNQRSIVFDNVNPTITALCYGGTNNNSNNKIVTKDATIVASSSTMDTRTCEQPDGSISCLKSGRILWSV